MKIIAAPEQYEKQERDILLFLAGGITNCPDWQKEVIALLEKVNPSDLVVFNPRRDNFPIHDPNVAKEQITWEFKYLNMADIFTMYFSSGDSDQPICMYELGRNIVRMQMKYPTDWEKRIVVSIARDYKRFDDANFQTQFACGNKKIKLNTQYSEECLKEDHAQYIRNAWWNLKYNR